MPKKVAPKRRNPQDATLRNIRALKKRVDVLEADMKRVDKLILVILRRPNG
jgi:hypothetical protein